MLGGVPVAGPSGSPGGGIKGGARTGGGCRDRGTSAGAEQKAEMSAPAPPGCRGHRSCGAPPPPAAPGCTWLLSCTPGQQGLAGRAAR